MYNDLSFNNEAGNLPYMNFDCSGVNSYKKQYFSSKISYEISSYDSSYNGYEYTIIDATYYPTNMTVVYAGNVGNVTSVFVQSKYNTTTKVDVISFAGTYSVFTSSGTTETEDVVLPMNYMQYNANGTFTWNSNTNDASGCCGSTYDSTTYYYLSLYEYFLGILIIQGYVQASSSFTEGPNGAVLTAPYTYYLMSLT
jgi:hypothetical protein